MITLSADNRSLLDATPFSFLTDNVASGASTLEVVNADAFAVNDFILLGLFGVENAEIFRVTAVNTATNTLTLADKDGNSASTVSPHAESTKVTVIPFNEIRFYWTAATGTIADENPTFDTANPLTGWTNLTPSDWFTSFSDTDHATGFGWFVFRNSITLESSQPSNAIPYTGFASNSVQQIFSDFMSLLSNRELKLVTQEDMYSWLNEGHSITRNKLNLSNPEYTVSSAKTLTLVPGTSEYLLDADFGDLVEIIDGEAYPIRSLTIRQAMSYTGDVPHYYIRGRYLGIVPTPAQAGTYTYRYRSKGTRLTSYDDLIDLPDMGFYILKDWMMWRACLKFQNPNASTYYKSFADGLNTLIASSVKRDASLDSWGIAPSANA